MKKTVVLKTLKNIIFKINLFKTKIIIIIALLFTVYLLSLLNNSDLDKLITSLGLLTLLIPLAMGVLLDVYQKRREEGSDFTALDLQVILNRVFKIRWLVCFVLLIFIPMLFWKNTSNLVIRFLELTASSIGLFFIGSTIFETYYWIKGSMFHYRFDYLKTLKLSEDTIICWKSVWSVDGNLFDNFVKEFKFFQIFITNVNELIRKSKKGQNTRILSTILAIFEENLKNRASFFFYVSDKVFPEILKSHFMGYKTLRQFQEKDSSDNYIFYKIAIEHLDQIIIDIEERALHDSRFSSLTNYLQKHLEEVVKQDSELNLKEKRDYLNLLFKNIFSKLFKKIEEVDKPKEILKDFPENWKVTKTNLESEDRAFSVIFLGHFLDWINNLIQQKNDKIKLDEVFEILFPNVNKKIMIEAFKLIFVPSVANKTRIESVVEYPWYSDIEKIERSVVEENTENINAFELIISIAKIDDRFSKLVDKKIIEEYINEAKQPSYFNALAEGEKSNYISLLEGMHKYLDKKDNLNHEEKI